ncbi:MAG TPA: hypothetical protein VG412_02505 [Acidimicrobiales bacterium]|nr:hypothetical protein [Acidimicrobiales bacterium]
MIPDNAVLVVRGEDLDPEILRADASRFLRRFGGWGKYGISAFLAADESEVDVLCETRLEAFTEVVVFTRSDLEGSGVEVVATFRRPHVTLAHVELNALVNGILTCEHRVLRNPHHHKPESSGP